MTKPKTFKQIMNKLVYQEQVISGTEEEINDMEMDIHDLKVENARLKDALVKYAHKIIYLQSIIKGFKDDQH